jgi:hypothetical protein
VHAPCLVAGDDEIAVCMTPLEIAFRPFSFHGDLTCDADLTCEIMVQCSVDANGNNGFQPRLGISYQASPRTVFSAAFAVLDDHNNTTVQLYANPRVSWPSSVQTTVSTLNQSLPTASSPLVYINNLPPETTFLNPTSTYVSYGFDPHTRIAYSNQYNAGIEHQFLNSFVLDIDYVGSENHNELIQATGNTARIPGPASYNALQAKLQKSLSSGLYFLASYSGRNHWILHRMPLDQRRRMFITCTRIGGHRISI